ncbi:hypothetical protein CXF83_01465 [Shewanella sp. Choline-02u-19]|jgi:hypothetical protein|uniref:hypothetical protein n=1 Tax=unclassified Shewanella TaxID=196818 RepID=UPI000C33617D|nr:MULTISPECIES: hypothetical protein [unclassified Shewanella]PKG75687.1 hypothetical protein CXF86_06145 [Shewanella sp. GutCb]PKH60588.1 hypothetical protein CXF84_02275 [Shewanella sp. Bg11-22]PKI30416.1 hypothetical protein CXF83_01465 [Shewanella sp. Choline-02u-19]
MISLDSVYAMLARPPLREIKQKNGVKPVDNSAAIAADSHEQPQSQLPPNLERRQSREERRKNPPGLYQLEPTLERRKNYVEDRRDDEERHSPADKEDDSPFPHIDINI